MSAGIFGRAKYIFGFRVFNYTHWALVRVPGRVRWDGLKQMCLDDVVPIGKLLPFRDVIISGAQACCWPRVLCSKKDILVTSVYLHLFQSFPGIRGRRNGWMGSDGSG